MRGSSLLSPQPYVQNPQLSSHCHRLSLVPLAFVWGDPPPDVCITLGVQMRLLTFAGSGCEVGSPASGARVSEG